MKQERRDTLTGFGIFGSRSVSTGPKETIHAAAKGVSSFL